MQEIGTKIREIRKRKAISQEELAEEAKVNLRTIQRIENNESEPRGKTLHLICSALEVNAEDLMEYGKEEDDSYLMFLHLSVLSFLALPLGNIILPTILWLTKKDRIVGLKKAGANLLNFQIHWTILTSLCLILGAISKVMHWPGANIMLALVIPLYLLNAIIAITFAVKAKNGKQPKYPVPFKLVS